MREFAVYTLWRLGLFVATYALVVGAYALLRKGEVFPMAFGWPLLAALIVSSIASIYLLRGQRERFAAVVERRATTASRRFEAARSKEDEPGG